MKKNTKIILTTLILPGLIAELLTGSSPPLEYFNLITFLFNIFLYGCGVLLIREAKVKWNLQWSIIFLVLAYGILEEGLTTKALFNINWADVGIYANYKTYFGILFPWSIVLLTFHATVSTLIPLLIVDLTWPEFQKKSLLNKNGIIYSFACLISVSLVGLSFMGTIINNKMIPYYPNPLLLIGSFFLILFFIFLAYKLRKSRILTNRKILKTNFFLVFSFLFMLSFIIIPHLLAQNNVNQLLLITYQIFIILLAFIFVYYQIYNKNITKIHLINIVFGSLLFWNIMTIILESEGIYGMGLIGIISFIILIIWKNKIK